MAKRKTIADELQKLIDSKADIAEAIEQMGGIVPSEFSQYGDAIRRLHIDEGNPVLFIDYDGRVIFSYTATAAQALTELPRLPQREGMDNQGWNFTLSEMKEQLTRCGNVVVGCNYKPIDGKTRIKVKLDSAKSFPLCFGQTMLNSISVDWGDESPAETYSDTTDAIVRRHAYAQAGTYTIVITPIDGLPVFGHQTFNICGFSATDRSDAVTTCSQIQEVQLGDVYGTLQGTFQFCTNLSAVNIPKDITNISIAAFSEAQNLVGVVLPNSVTSIDKMAFAQNPKMRYVSIPPSVTAFNRGYYFLNDSALLRTNLTSSIITFDTASAFDGCKSYRAKVVLPSFLTTLGTSMFRYCNSMSGIDIPSGVTSIEGQCFLECCNLSKLEFPSTLTSIAASAFAQCWGIQEFDFTACTSIPALLNGNAFSQTSENKRILVRDNLYNTWATAANWAEYADYMTAQSI